MYLQEVEKVISKCQKEGILTLTKKKNPQENSDAKPVMLQDYLQHSLPHWLTDRCSYEIIQHFFTDAHEVSHAFKTQECLFKYINVQHMLLNAIPTNMPFVDNACGNSNYLL